MSALPPVRRIVTVQSDAQKAVVLKDGTITPRDLPGKATKRGDIWLTESLPADNIAGQGGDQVNWTGVVHPSGASFRFIDMPPGESLSLHYTNSIDYGICMVGEVTLELTHGAFISVKAGDVIIQMGNVHAWHNKSTEWARLCWVLLPAKPLTFEGEAIQGHQH